MKNWKNNVLYLKLSHLIHILKNNNYHYHLLNPLQNEFLHDFYLYKLIFV